MAEQDRRFMIRGDRFDLFLRLAYFLDACHYTAIALENLANENPSCVFSRERTHQALRTRCGIEWGNGDLNGFDLPDEEGGMLKILQHFYSSNLGNIRETSCTAGSILERVFLVDTEAEGHRLLSSDQENILKVFRAIAAGELTEADFRD